MIKSSKITMFTMHVVRTSIYVLAMIMYVLKRNKMKYVIIISRFRLIADAFEWHIIRIRCIKLLFFFLLFLNNNSFQFAFSGRMRFDIKGAFLFHFCMYLIIIIIININLFSSSVEFNVETIIYCR